MPQKGYFVWVVFKDNKSKLRPGAVRNWYDSGRFICEGLQAGEQVVVDGGLTLHPGAAEFGSFARASDNWIYHLQRKWQFSESLPDPG